MAPIFVGSNNEDSRIRSNRIGFAVSTANPGSASEGDGYYNSTNNQLSVNDGSAWNEVLAGGGTFDAVASGSLSDGSTVVINTDGTVGIITSTSTSDSVGSASNSAGNALFTTTFGATYDSNSNKVVIAYAYNSAIYAQVGHVSGTSITWGSSPVELDSGSGGGNYFSLTFDSNSNKVVVTYSRTNSASGRAVVCTVGGTDASPTITAGSSVIFNSSASSYTSATFDSSNNKVVIAYSDGGNSSYGTAIVGTVSGTSISFGSEVVFESASSLFIAATFDSSNNKVVISYSDGGNSDAATAIVGTVSGTSISFGSAAVFDGYCFWHTSTFDSTNNKVVFTYADANNSSYGTACVGTVSGTSITFGTPVVFYSAVMNRSSGITFDSNAGKVVVAYGEGSSSGDTFAKTGTVSGTSISFGNQITVDTNHSHYTVRIAYNSTSNSSVIVNIYSSNIYGFVFTAGSTSSNLTSSNFIGFSDSAYTNGQTATIQIISSVDDAQTGLTTGSQYYVQTNGTLSTSAGSPSVFAGTALSATKISIKN